MGKPTLGVIDEKESVEMPNYQLIEEGRDQPRQTRAKRKCWARWIVGLIGVLLLAAGILITVKFCIKQKDEKRLLHHYTPSASQMKFSTSTVGVPTGEVETEEPTAEEPMNENLFDTDPDQGDIHISKDDGAERGMDEGLFDQANQAKLDSGSAMDMVNHGSDLMDVFKGMVDGLKTGDKNLLSNLGSNKGWPTVNKASTPDPFSYYYNYDDVDEGEPVWTDSDDEYTTSTPIWWYKSTPTSVSTIDDFWSDDSDEDYDYNWTTAPWPSTSPWPDYYYNYYGNYDDNDIFVNDDYEIWPGNETATRRMPTTWSENYDDDDDDYVIWPDDYESVEVSETSSPRPTTTVYPWAFNYDWSTMTTVDWKQEDYDDSYYDDDDTIWPDDQNQNYDSDQYTTTPYYDPIWSEPARNEDDDMANYADALADAFGDMVDDEESTLNPTADVSFSDEEYQPQTTPWEYSEYETTAGFDYK